MGHRGTEEEAERRNHERDGASRVAGGGWMRCGGEGDEERAIGEERAVASRRGAEAARLEALGGYHPDADTPFEQNGP
jgi:hypothetical protein